MSSATVRADSLSSSVFMLLVLTVFQRVVGLARGLLFCRWLDPDQLGQWDLAFGFLMFAAPVAVLGLPGSFGRYAEYYRQSGHLRSFLLRIGGVTVLLLVVASAAIAVVPGWFSNLIFGEPQLQALTIAVAVVLAAVIAHNTLTSLFSALRLFRVVSLITFVQGILFAAFGLALARFWQPTALAIVVAFGLATVIASLCAATWLRRIWQELPPSETVLRHRDLWRKLVPFALSVWAANWLFNLVELVDRYMLIHYSGLPADAALALVGQYHSSKVVPLLLQSVAELVAGVLMPHLSYHWESGQRAAVAQKTNLALKLLAIGLTLGAAVVLVGKPILFGVVLQGKYAAGEQVLPWILLFCIWGGLTTVGSSYLYCHERVGWNSFTVFVGLIVNVVLNLLWLPLWGLYGVVLATTVARFVSLVLLLALCKVNGLQLDRGLILASLVPLLLIAGPWTTLAGLLWLALAASRGLPGMLSQEDRHELTDWARGWLNRLRLTREPSPAAGT